MDQKICYINWIFVKLLHYLSVMERAAYDFEGVGGGRVLVKSRVFL